MKPVHGSPASPDFGEQTGAEVPLKGELKAFYDGTGYAGEARATGELPPADGQVGPGMMKPPVWTWEVPVYFWFGGIASGAAFVALACDLAGDERSARRARLVSLAAVGPCPPLLVMDLGRPERFLNMLRVFKTRSPMSMGAWALTVFGNIGAAAVGADLLGRRRTAQALGAANALVAGYLGSYTGVLLASTAVPVWAKSRLFLGPIFVSTATATGAAAVRLVCADADSRKALGHVQAGAMACELILSEINERRLGKHAAHGKPMKAAKWLTRLGLAAQATRRTGPLPSVIYLAAGLLFRFAWVEAGKHSARDDHSVAAQAR